MVAFSQKRVRDSDRLLYYRHESANALGEFAFGDLASHGGNGYGERQANKGMRMDFLGSTLGVAVLLAAPLAWGTAMAWLFGRIRRRTPREAAE